MGEHHGVVSASTMLVHRGSNAASTTATTTRPKIRIIHIIAPEIIKTDVANFRELVQRLTGKPAGAAVDMDMVAPPVEEEVEEETMIRKRPAPSTTTTMTVQPEKHKKRKIKCEVKVEEGGLSDYELDRSNELWMDLNPGGFLSFLEEDVFKGMAADHDFLQPLVGSSRMDLVGEMYAS
ncbi:hypothetical protein ACP4OV_013562 [Aristida adscensionis]